MIQITDSNGKIWAAGVSGGLWSITNIDFRNSEWSKVSDFWDNLVISSMAYDPNDTNIMYVGTGERRGKGSNGKKLVQGVWKNLHGGGNTWSHLIIY